jgi:hypothetical protein
MTSRWKIVIIVLVVAITGFKAVKWTVHAIEVPSCHSKEAVNAMIEALHDPALGTVAVNNATTLSGGVFSSVRRCTADIAPVRGGVDAADMHWMRVTYQVRKSTTPDSADVTATLAGDTMLAPERSTLAKWFEYILD